VARSLRQLSENRTGAKPRAVISPRLRQCREPTNKALTDKLMAYATGLCCQRNSPVAW
jgi:hypothetical protein